MYPYYDSPTTQVSPCSYAFWSIWTVRTSAMPAMVCIESIFLWYLLPTQSSKMMVYRSLLLSVCFTDSLTLSSYKKVYDNPHSGCSWRAGVLSLFGIRIDTMCCCWNWQCDTTLTVMQFWQIWPETKCGHIGAGNLSEHFPIWLGVYTRFSDTDLRLQCDDRTIYEVRNHPFWSFCSWCATKVNLLHRLKYLTNAIVETLEKPDYHPSLVDIRCPQYRYSNTRNLEGTKMLNVSWYVLICWISELCVGSEIFRYEILGNL